MKTVSLLIILLVHKSYSKIYETKQTKDQQPKDRQLGMPFGNSMLSPPHVSPPPPIFDQGILPIQPVFNLMHFPHQYSSPMVDYAYPTVFNPYYNHLQPYGMGQQYANPHILSSMGMYGLHPHTQSMYQNGFFGMLPYQNAQIPGMEQINNSSQNWNDDRRLNRGSQKLNNRDFIQNVSNQWQNAYQQMSQKRQMQDFEDVQNHVFKKFRQDMMNKKKPGF